MNGGVPHQAHQGGQGDTRPHHLGAKGMTQPMRMSLRDLTPQAVVTKQRAQPCRGHGTTPLAPLQRNEQSGAVG